MSASLGAMTLTINSAWDVTVEDDSVTVHTKVGDGNDSFIDVVLSLHTLRQIQVEVDLAKKERR